MSMLVNVILTVQILTALGMIGLILIQHGKGADMGAAFGSASFLSRTTAVLAAVFFVCTLALAYFGNARPASTGSVLETPAAVVPVAPDAGSAAAIPGNAAPGAVAAPAAAQAASEASPIPAK